VLNSPGHTSISEKLEEIHDTRRLRSAAIDQVVSFESIEHRLDASFAIAERVSEVAEIGLVRDHAVFVVVVDHLSEEARGELLDRGEAILRSELNALIVDVHSKLGDSRTTLRRDGDRDTEVREHLNQHIDAEQANAATHEIADAWLRHAQRLSGFLLREAS